MNTFDKSMKLLDQILKNNGKNSQDILIPVSIKSLFEHELWFIFVILIYLFHFSPGPNG